MSFNENILTYAAHAINLFSKLRFHPYLYKMFPHMNVNTSFKYDSYLYAVLCYNNCPRFTGTTLVSLYNLFFQKFFQYHKKAVCSPSAERPHMRCVDYWNAFVTSCKTYWVVVKKVTTKFEPYCEIMVLFCHTIFTLNIQTPCPEVIKLFFILNSAEHEIYPAYIYISMIKTTFERLKARNFFICWYFSFHEQLKFHAQLS